MNPHGINSEKCYWICIKALKPKFWIRFYLRVSKVHQAVPVLDEGSNVKVHLSCVKV